MIPKTLLLAFLSLQGTREPQTPNRGAALSNIAQFDVVNELTATLHDARAEIDEAINEIEFFTGPSVQEGANDQVPFAIFSGEQAVAGSDLKEINFTSKSVPNTDDFKILNRQNEVFWEFSSHPFQHITAPPGITYAWGSKATIHGLLEFSFGVGVQDVKVQFGWIDDESLQNGSYTITGSGLCGSETKSGEFPKGHWVDTHPLNKPATNFTLFVPQDVRDKVLAVTRVYYKL